MEAVDLTAPTVRMAGQLMGTIEALISMLDPEGPQTPNGGLPQALIDPAGNRVSSSYNGFFERLYDVFISILDIIRPHPHMDRH